LIISDDIIWKECHPEDLWVFDKLILSRVLGYVCGPTGLQVPKPDFYCVRPISNFMGMGRYARIEWIDDSTEHFHPGEFWCEVFTGEHLSVDFYKTKPALIILGERSPDNPLYKWDRWTKVNRTVDFPSVLGKLKGVYEWINCEFIGDKLIEIHFRQNPDFSHDNTVAIPVWDDEIPESKSEFEFVSDPDYYRKGFYIQ